MRVQWAPTQTVLDKSGHEISLCKKHSYLINYGGVHGNMVENMQVDVITYVVTLALESTG